MVISTSGYTVHAIAIAGSSKHCKYKNAENIHKYFQNSLFVKRPPKVFNFLPITNERLLHNWFRENESNFLDLFDFFEHSVSKELVSSFSEEFFGENQEISAPLIVESSFGNKRRCMQIKSLAKSGGGSTNNSSNHSNNHLCNSSNYSVGGGVKLKEYGEFIDIDQDSDIVFFPDLIDGQGW